MIKHTENKPIAQLFSADNNVTYHIPKYQREYVWGKENWENLFDDINEAEGAHFLGSIICIDTQVDSMKAGEMELVDGQQRMTTISLLILALIQFIHENAPDVNDRSFDRKLWSIIDRITSGDGKHIRLSPSHSNYNYQDYKFIFGEVLHGITEFPKTNKIKWHGNRQIRRAFRYFQDRLRELDVKDQPLFTFEGALGFIEKLNNATLVKIDVDSHADAFTLFETLNNRGIPLSAIDIIKNKLLGQLEISAPKTNLDDNFERWNRILSNLGEEYAVQERFLRQVYNAFRLDPNMAVDRIKKATRSNLIRIYDALIDRDAARLFNQLEEYAAIYALNIRYDEFDDVPEEVLQSLRNLENVSGMDGYMLLLYLEKRFSIQGQKKSELIDFLCRYFIRRNVTDLPPTRDLTNLFMDMIGEIHEWKEYDFSALKEVILRIGRPAENEFFEEKLKGDLYTENVGATRFILASLEHSATGTREKRINFYKRKRLKGGSEKFVWTIEHILPQGNKLPQEWIDMVGNGNQEKARDCQQRLTHKIGNLTLTGYNSQLSNMSFERKKERRSKEGRPIGFNNGLHINQYIYNLDKWVEDSITIRTKQIVQETLHLFDLNR